MKTWIIGAALLVGTTLQVAAQQGKRGQVNPEERAKKVTEKMATELELSEEQKSQILELNLDQAKIRQAEIDHEMDQRKQRSAQMKAHEEKIKAILTDEQRSKWEEIKMENREKRRSQGQVHGRDELPRQGRGN
ncbi:DUF4890 domain-containing protein [Algoriphagus litoralis]|uniref:DUF4890 domain-containing protein n=1 Tax=Algoriphagus litoralis TaxID=2202829 RepID=UPI000DB93118|nr:DUF4890 domain-containing protein [Algoriphagus litoralis]